MWGGTGCWLKREWQVTNNRCYDNGQYKISIVTCTKSMRLFLSLVVDGIYLNVDVR